MRKLTACCLILLLLISSAPLTSAKPQADWSNLKNFIGQAIAVKTQDGVTSFGILGYVDDSEMKVQLAYEEELSAQETHFRRPEVMKVWQAKLRFGETNTRKGAPIGLGLGFGAGYVTALVVAKRENGGAPHGFAYSPLSAPVPAL